MARTRSTIDHKRIRGTLRADRLHIDTMPPLTTLPAPPASLCSVACAAWQRFGQQALELGTLSAFDTGVLELLAVTWANCLELQELLAREGVTIESRGSRKAHPASAALDRSRALAARLLAVLGLTPLARRGVDIFAPLQALSPRDEKHQRDRERRDRKAAKYFID